MLAGLLRCGPGRTADLRPRLDAGHPPSPRGARLRLLHAQRRTSPAARAVEPDPFPGDSTGVGGRLDLHKPPRPHPGDGQRSEEAQAVPLPPTRWLREETEFGRMIDFGLERSPGPARARGLAWRPRAA